jgi:hypothetical protein
MADSSTLRQLRADSDRLAKELFAKLNRATQQLCATDTSKMSASEVATWTGDVIRVAKKLAVAFPETTSESGKAVTKTPSKTTASRAKGDFQAPNSKHATRVAPALPSPSFREVESRSLSESARRNRASILEIPSAPTERLIFRSASDYLPPAKAEAAADRILGAASG